MILSIRFIIISFIFLFIANCSTGTKVVNSNKIKPGMTKDKVNLVLYVNAILDQITIPQSYREYFNNENKEILGDDKGKVYYVFKNVYTPVKCGVILCDTGNGVLEKIFFNYSDARKFIKGIESKTINKKKTVTIEENGKVKEVDVADVENLQSIIKDFENGIITEEEFNQKKAEILK